MTTASYASEIERKAVETADDLAYRHSRGVLTDREFRIAINAVWDSTSGLVDAMTEIMNAVADMDLKDTPVQTVVTNGTKSFIVGRNRLNVSVINTLTKEESNFKVFDTETEAAEHQQKLVQAFQKKGFTVL